MPGIIQCETCNHGVYEDTARCPNCKTPVRPEWVAEQKRLSEAEAIDITGDAGVDEEFADPRRPVPQAMYGPPPYALRQSRRFYAVAIVIGLALAVVLILYFMR